MDCWINLYKPRSMSSAKAVSYVKRCFKNVKIGHTGTLDPEAEGVLPLALGQATKLCSILIDSSKDYYFKVQFGIKTDSGDIDGKIIETTDIIPSETQCIEVCKKFIGNYKQVPPNYSAIKVNGKRAYSLARDGQEFILPAREVKIHHLECVSYDEKTRTAIFFCSCSKGTYIRTLAEDISFYLQSLGFVLELRRSRVGLFSEANSINLNEVKDLEPDEQFNKLKDYLLDLEFVLDDIPVLSANEETTQDIRHGKKVIFDADDCDLLWIKYNKKIIAIGSLCGGEFKSRRVFNN